MSSYRSARLVVILKKTLGEVLSREFSYEGALVTITEVQLNKTEEKADVGLSIIPETKAPEVLKILKSLQGRLQRILIKKMNLRFVPRIEFVLDEGLSNAARVDKLLDNE